MYAFGGLPSLAKKEYCVAYGCADCTLRKCSRSLFLPSTNRPCLTMFLHARRTDHGTSSTCSASLRKCMNVLSGTRGKIRSLSSPKSSSSNHQSSSNQRMRLSQITKWLWQPESRHTEGYKEYPLRVR